MNAQLIAVEDYNRHRTIIGYLGIVLIVGVVLLDVLFSMASSSIGPDFAFLKGSISAYYHSAGGVLFVAILAIIGVALLAYQGFDDDGRFTNYAGICALGIAVFPTYPSDGVVAQHFGLPSTTAFWPDIFDAPLSSVLHGCFAISFFFLLWYIMRFRFTKSGRPKNNRKYRILSSVMLFSMGIPFVIFILEHLFKWPGVFGFIDKYNIIFWVEVVGILCFSAAWLTKGRAIVPVVGQLYTDEPSTKEELERYNQNMKPDDDRQRIPVQSD